MKIQSVHELYDVLQEEERIITDVLRQIVSENLPDYCMEKISYNVPYCFGHKGICIIWPASIPRGGIKEGVLLGFWQGYLLQDHDEFLIHGTNKKIYYHIFKSIDSINEKAVVKLLKEAVELDRSFEKKRPGAF